MTYIIKYKEFGRDWSSTTYTSPEPVTEDYLIEFFDGVDDFTLDSCKELASRTFPDRDTDEGVPLYLKNRTTGEVLYDARMSESRKRSK